MFFFSRLAWPCAVGEEEEAGVATGRQSIDPDGADGQEAPGDGAQEGDDVKDEDEHLSQGSYGFPDDPRVVRPADASLAGASS